MNMVYPGERPVRTEGYGFGIDKLSEVFFGNSVWTLFFHSEFTPFSTERYVREA